MHCAPRRFRYGRGRRAPAQQHNRGENRKVDPTGYSQRARNSPYGYQKKRRRQCSRRSAERVPTVQAINFALESFRYGCDVTRQRRKTCTHQHGRQENYQRRKRKAQHRQAARTELRAYWAMEVAAEPEKRMSESAAPAGQ